MYTRMQVYLSECSGKEIFGIGSPMLTQCGPLQGVAEWHPCPLLCACPPCREVNEWASTASKFYKQRIKQTKIIYASDDGGGTWDVVGRLFPMHWPQVPGALGRGQAMAGEHRKTICSPPSTPDHALLPPGAVLRSAN